MRTDTQSILDLRHYRNELAPLMGSQRHLIYITQVTAFCFKGISIEAAKSLLLDEYNGWKNWQTWNVSLWIMNDMFTTEELFHAIRYSGDLITASVCFTDRLGCYPNGHVFRGNRSEFSLSSDESGLLTTPDGAVYTARAVRAVMEHYPELLGTKGKDGLWGDDWLPARL